MVDIFVTQRPVPGTHGNVRLWYGSVKSHGQTSLDEVATRIEAMCTVTKPDIVAVLAAFQEQVKNILMSGCGVQLGELGYIYAKVKSVLADTPQDCSTDMVESVYPSFRPSSRLKNLVTLGDVNMRICGYGKPYVAPAASA